jgi:hypothetical protein
VVGLYLPEDNPQRAEVPPAPTLAEVMKDFKGKADVSASEAFEPTQANIEARTKRATFGGVKVALLPKKNRGEVVNVTLQLRLGNEKDLFGKRRAAMMSGAMLSRGTTKFTRGQLARRVRAPQECRAVCPVPAPASRPRARISTRRCASRCTSFASPPSRNRNSSS